jgi:hypothetical protein
MIFGPQLLPLVLDGSKTQTRRSSDRYSVGHTYAVQPGRGKRAVAQIKVLSTRPERLLDISEQDARAEGFFPHPPLYSARDLFMQYWHDVVAEAEFDQTQVVNVIEFELVADG